MGITSMYYMGVRRGTLRHACLLLAVGLLIGFCLVWMVRVSGSGAGSGSGVGASSSVIGFNWNSAGSPGWYELIIPNPTTVIHGIDVKSPKKSAESSRSTEIAGMSEQEYLAQLAYQITYYDQVMLQKQQKATYDQYFEEDPEFNGVLYFAVIIEWEYYRNGVIEAYAEEKNIAVNDIPPDEIEKLGLQAYQEFKDTRFTDEKAVRMYCPPYLPYKSGLTNVEIANRYIEERGRLTEEAIKESAIRLKMNPEEGKLKPVPA